MDQIAVEQRRIESLNCGAGIKILYTSLGPQDDSPVHFSDDQFRIFFEGK